MYDIVVEGLSKSYEKQKVLALDNISLKVAKGELFGLIGPDGAGKTSLFRILTTLLLPDSGYATVSGSHIVNDYKAIRHKVGYMPGKFSLYQDLTVEENLIFFATIFGTTIKENYSLIEDIYVQIEPFKNRKAGKLSGGMKQKLALCCALIHRPTVLFLDEPTTGVDAVSRREFWEMLRRLKSDGITILVSTPYMDEANLCERIALLQDGRILSIDTPEGIIKSYPDKLYAIKAEQMGLLLKDLRSLDMIKTVYSFGEFHHISFVSELDPSINPLDYVRPYLKHSKVECHQIPATVEDSFIHLMTSK